MTDSSEALILMDIRQLISIVAVCLVISTSLLVIRWICYVINNITKTIENQKSILLERLFEQGKYEDLIYECDKLLIKRPNKTLYIWWKARALRELKRYEEATPLFVRALELSPEWKESTAVYFKDGHVVPISG